jgi:hypothetical protein
MISLMTTATSPSLGRANPAHAGVVRQIAVPPRARALSTLPRIDYDDAFLVDVAGDRTPEAWARAIFDDAPLGLRATLWSAWLALGLRHGPLRSDHHILGWTVRRSTQDHVLLGSRSRIGMPAELLVERHDDGPLLFCTFVAKETRLARAAWASVDPAHRPAVRLVLGRAARRAR